MWKLPRHALPATAKISEACSVAGMLLVAGLYGALAYFSVAYTIDSGRIAAFWLGNAVVIGLLLHRPLGCKVRQVAACLFANLIANLMNSDTLAVGLGLSLANTLEIGLALFLLEKVIPNGCYLRKIKQLGFVGATGAAVPAMVGLIPALFLQYHGLGDFLSNWWRWFSAHTIAIPIFTSMILVVRDFLFLHERPDRDLILRWGTVVVSFAVTIMAVFCQTTYPFLFLALPLVIYAAFRTGMLGTAVVVAGLTIAASVATYLGYGPIALVKGGIREEMIALQVFLATCVAVGLPVAAVLEERAEVRKELRNSRDFIKTIVDGTGDVVFKIDRDWRWTFLNRQWSIITGSDPEEALGSIAFACMHPEDGDKFDDLKSEIEAGRKRQEKTLLRVGLTDGILRHLAIGVEPQFDETGAFCGGIGSFSDVSERVVREHALVESEARFRRLAEASPVGIIQADRDGKVTYVNSVWLKRFKLEARDMLGDGWRNALATGEEYEDDEAFTGFNKPGDVRHRVIRFRDGDGRDFWCETVNAAEFDENGHIVGFVGALHDITEQREAIEQLKESDRRFQVLANMAPAGIFRTDASGNCTYVNEAWKQMTGLEDGEWEGAGWSKALHPDDAKGIEMVWVEAVAEGRRFDEEFRWLRPDGSTIWTQVISGPEFDATGKVVGYIGVVSDVTERKRTQAALEMQTGELSLLADNATDAVLRLATDGTCKYASPSARHLFGVDHRAMLGHQFITGFHDDDAMTVRSEFASLANGDKERTRLTFRSRSLVEPGQYNWFEANCGLVRDPLTGAPSEVIASLRNVNQTKQLEADLTAAGRAAEAAGEAKSAFLANMSHEIRTPMNGVIGFTELALMGDITAEQREQLEMIADSGRAMLRLLNDLLDLAKIESNQMAFCSEPTDLRHKLSGCLRLMEPVAKQKSITLALNVAEDVPRWVRTDPMRLRQIMLNLIGNALKFTDKGEVLVGVAVSRDEAAATVHIDVRDTGIGIAADRIDQVFEKFTQADDSTARRFGGTGLGLPISAQLAGLLGGHLRARSEPGKGSTFTLTFPLEECAEPERAENPADASGQEPRSGLHVLVAEDNPINQRLTLSMLEKAGVTADLAEDGAQAIALVEQQHALGRPYSLVLMDMQMPTLDGLEATRRLRASGHDAQSLPIVALSANAYAEDIAACRTAGMQSHMAKPLRMRDLQVALATWARAETVEVAADFEQETSPELVRMYCERKTAAVVTIDEALREGRLERHSIEGITSQLHQIAGIAAFFGEARLGEASSEIESVLPTTDAARLPAVLGWIRQMLAA